jgi:hypothetical protein
MSIIKRQAGWIVLIVLVVAGVAVALGRATSSDAIIVYDKPAPLGLVGLTEGQTLRVSVAHVVGLQPPPEPDRVCSLKVGFVDRENRGYGIPDTFELRPGIARSFDFVATGDGSVRPVVVDLRPKDKCPAVVSGEILDRDGVGGIVINWSTPLQPAAFAK